MRAISTLMALVALSAPAVAADPEIGRVCMKQVVCDDPMVQYVTKVDWGDDWPLNVETAVIVCARKFGGGGQIVVAGGSAWAANGATQMLGDKQALRVEVDGRWLPVREFDWNEGSRASKLRADSGDWRRFIMTAAEMGCSL